MFCLCHSGIHHHNDQCSCACQVHWSLNFFTDLSDDRSYSRHAAWRTTVTVCDSTQVGCESITQIWLSGHVHIESICQLGCQHHIIQSPHRSVTFLSSDLSPSYLAWCSLCFWRQDNCFSSATDSALFTVIKLTKADYHLVMFSGIFWCYSPHHYFSVYMLMLLRILIPFWKKAATDEEDVFSGTSWLVFTCSYSGLKANDGT